MNCSAPCEYLPNGLPEALHAGRVPPEQGRLLPPQGALWRSLKRWILPVDVLGSSGMNSTQRGYLYGASESLTNALSSSASAAAAVVPSAQTTYAHGLIRPSPSARATTAHSRTAA